MKAKNQKAATKMLPGHVQRRRVRCGKPNCKCARGKLHTAHYHVWHSAGGRAQRYVPRAEVEEVRRACDANRARRAELRAGHAAYRHLLARLRGLAGGL